MTPPITSAPEQRLTAAALVQFCDLYRPGDPSVDPVRRCLLALDAGDIGVALTAFREVPLGGYGCFNDWLPIDDEDADYRWAVFLALTERWARLMRALPDSAGHR